MTKTEIYEEFSSLKRRLKKEIIKVPQEEIYDYHRIMFLAYEEKVQEISKELRGKDDLTKTDKYQLYLVDQKVRKASKKIDEFLGIA